MSSSSPEVFAAVHLGYRNGVALTSCHAAPALYRNLLTDWTRNVPVLCLWPHDFPISARQETSVRPLATLWRPQFSVVTQDEFGVSGLERQQAGAKARWLVQRWMCRPMPWADLAAERSQPDQRFGEIKPHAPPT
jgi:hypothetical protein